MKPGEILTINFHPNNKTPRNHQNLPINFVIFSNFLSRSQLGLTTIGGIIRVDPTNQDNTATKPVFRTNLNKTLNEQCL